MKTERRTSDPAMFPKFLTRACPTIDRFGALIPILRSSSVFLTQDVAIATSYVMWPYPNSALDLTIKRADVRRRSIFSYIHSRFLVLDANFIFPILFLFTWRNNFLIRFGIYMCWEKTNRPAIVDFTTPLISTKCAWREIGKQHLCNMWGSLLSKMRDSGK